VDVGNQLLLFFSIELIPHSLETFSYLCCREKGETQEVGNPTTIPVVVLVGTAEANFLNLKI
jgi:hypothetical protein